ncbi:MAG: 16S rRNA (guanine(966)-N(2))-methyltransferase RsmD [Isosphaeraceae bacterium]
MRVVGGEARGKLLQLVPGDGTRPIQDRVKTALFDILRPRLDGMVLLDLFAGTGGVGIEALSQGADSCTFTDMAGKAVATIRKNLQTTGLADRAEVRQIDALAYLRHAERQYDLIYVAPPQYKRLWVEAMEAIADRPEIWRDGEGLAIAQIDPKEYEALNLPGLVETRQKRYGNTLLVFYESGADPASLDPPGGGDYDDSDDPDGDG